MPRWSKVIDLINTTPQEDDDGYASENASPKEKENIFANKLSVGRSEFYQASREGYKISLVIEIRTVEYEDEEELRYEGKLYEIVRT